MDCTHCGKPVDLSQKSCPHCGLLLDADHSGLPDALEKVIEQKARELIAADREKQEEDRATAAARAREDEKAKVLAEKRSARDAARQRLEAVRATPERGWKLTRNTLIASFVLAVMVGMPGSCIAEDVSGVPAWGSLLCPAVCPDCRGPGRTVSWRSSKTGDHSIALCHTQQVDIETIRGSDAEKYGAITLSWWWRTPLTLFVLTLAWLVLLPFALGRGARRARRAELAELEAKVAGLSREVPEAAEASAPYR